LPRLEKPARKGKLRVLVNKKGKHMRRCALFKEPGHSARTCTSPIAPKANRPKREVVEKEIYDRVKERQYMDNSASDVAGRYELDLEVVNEIFESTSYPAL
jgi:hypothetical protein